MNFNKIFEKINIKFTKEKIIKFGIDPTYFSIHLGHFFIINFLFYLIYKKFIIIVIIGDYTASLKKKINITDLIINSICLKSQIKNLLGEIDVWQNSIWLKKISLKYFLKLIKTINIIRYNKTLKKNKNIIYNNIIYPIVQSYDSVFLKSNFEIGGIDQLLNIICGRILQKKFNLKKQNIITFKIICFKKKKISKSDKIYFINKININCFKIIEIIFFNLKKYNKNLNKKKKTLLKIFFLKNKIFNYIKKIYFIKRNFINFYFKKIFNYNKFIFYKMIYNKKIFLNKKILVKNIYYKKKLLLYNECKIIIYDKFYK